MTPYPLNRNPMRVLPMEELADFRGYSCEEVGLIMSLRWFIWVNNGLDVTSSDQIGLQDQLGCLARTFGVSAYKWKKLFQKISKFFTVLNGKLHYLPDTLRTPPVETPYRDVSGKPKKWRRQRIVLARMNGTHTKMEWAKLLYVCSYQCVKCGSQDDIAKDHIIPLSQEGSSDSIDNLQPLCTGCNGNKGSWDTTDYRPVGWREKMKFLEIFSPPLPASKEKDLNTPTTGWPAAVSLKETTSATAGPPTAINSDTDFHTRLCARATELSINLPDQNLSAYLHRRFPLLEPELYPKFQRQYSAGLWKDKSEDQMFSQANPPKKPSGLEENHADLFRWAAEQDRQAGVGS